jgi:hypothetical protein
MKGDYISVAGSGLGIFGVPIGCPSQEIGFDGVDREIDTSEILIRQANHGIRQGTRLIEVATYGLIAACLWDPQFQHFSRPTEYLPGSQNRLAVEVGGQSHRLRHRFFRSRAFLAFSTAFLALSSSKQYRRSAAIFMLWLCGRRQKVTSCPSGMVLRLKIAEMVAV